VPRGGYGPASAKQSGAYHVGSARFQRGVRDLGLTAVMNSEQREQVTQLEALTAEVVAHGWKADLYLPAGRLPYLSVYDPADATAHGDVVAMPDSDSGHWWFWFTWAERIALVENLGVAAEIIVGVLRQPVSLAAASSSPSSPGSYRYAS
jgi:hypothetical protein